MYQLGDGTVQGHEIQQVEGFDLSPDLILNVKQASFYSFMLLCAQLDDFPKSRAWGKGLCVGITFWEVSSYYRSEQLGRMKQGRRKIQARGARGCGQLKLDLEGADSTSELFSQGIKEGTTGMPHRILAPSHFHVCLGQNGWVHSTGISIRGGKAGQKVKHKQYSQATCCWVTPVSAGGCSNSWREKVGQEYEAEQERCPTQVVIIIPHEVLVRIKY